MPNHPLDDADDIMVRLRRAYDETGSSLLNDALTEIAALRRFVDGTVAKTAERSKPTMRFQCPSHGDFENSRGRTAYCPTCERICQRLICDTHDGGCDSPNLCSHENRCQNPFATAAGGNG